ncbi:hypothetical protein LJ737_16980 [Hymenobacter sp. 15J16-1T3B]|uniref:DUF6770 family protein n=1 Tax=Hymenobacter sp. 15J16-1T3B TaxID=2886941 RepID=UPI001D11D9D3|nr:DUF6770 family protein [Hymenobacter sp. 15J16-1T3B]MCC3158940.1 hypothetical protein [Hymenobacter sp. 15J16-1T3B]
MTTFYKRPLGGLLLLALTAGLLLPGRAQAQQQLSIKGVPGLPQLLPLEGKGYLALYRSEAGEDGHDLYAVRVLDPELKVKYQYALPVPVGAQPLATLPGKATYTLAFHGRGGAGLALYSFNPQTGAQLSRELEALPDTRRSPVGAPLVAGTPTDGVCLVQQYRNDTTGYAITVLDAALKPEWSQMYFPKDLRHHTPLKVAVSKDVITLVLSDSYVVKPNTREQRAVTEFAVLGIDRASGRVLYRTPTRRDGLTMLPEQLMPLADGRVATTGLYFNSRTTRVDSAQGVFLTTYKPDGTAAAPVLTSWADLGKSLNDPSLGPRIQSRRGYLPLHELITTTGTDLKLIGEYNTSVQPGGALQPGPFVVLSFDAAGKPSGAYPVARTFKAGSSADELRYSHYRNVVGKQAEPYLLYTGVEGQQEYAYATVLANVPTRTAARAASSLEKLPDPPAPPQPTNELQQGIDLFRKNLNTTAEAVNKFVYGEAPPQAQYFRPDPMTGFVAATPGKVLLYRYEPGRKLLRLQTVALQ